jgi:hypothetical protein
MRLAGMETSGAEDIYSYDEDCDGIAGVRRVEP